LTGINGFQAPSFQDGFLSNFADQYIIITP
jgi:hypothetical protein